MFKINIADLVVQIDNKHDFVYKQCKDYYTDEQDVDITICATDEDIRIEREQSLAQFSEGYLESVCIYRNLSYVLPQFDAFLFHAALIEVDGKGYAFTAKSGTGKSTHIRLWQQLLGDKVIIVNGDKPILRKVDGKILCYGTPWCGKEKYNVNKSVELNSICFLNRAKENSIHKYDVSKAAKNIVHQIVVPKSPENVLRILELLDYTLTNVDVWDLYCNMDIQAAKLSYNTMKGGTSCED